MLTSRSETPARSLLSNPRMVDFRGQAIVRAIHNGARALRGWIARASRLFADCWDLKMVLVIVIIVIIIR